jgi:GAF domain-containing protein
VTSDRSKFFDKADGEFTELDEAIVVHLAQMAAAALERARLYRPA